ncbi:hypothetical protein LINPERHAP2_LOCUS7294 [Linum perenne]
MFRDMMMSDATHLNDFWEDDGAISEDSEDDNDCPTVRIPKLVKGRVRRAWSCALIFRMLGKAFPYAFVDYDRALNEGPWLIGDHYVISKPWRPYYEPRVRRVEYEGLHVICFNCGIYGHNKDGCPTLIREETNIDPTADRAVFDNPFFQPGQVEVPRPELEEDFGTWMLAKKNVRRKQKIGDSPSNHNEPPATKKQPQGSRLTALSEDIVLEAEKSVDVTDNGESDQVSAEKMKPKQGSKLNGAKKVSMEEELVGPKQTLKRLPDPPDGHKKFLAAFRTYHEKFKPTIVFILEPRVSGGKANIVSRKLGYDNCVRMDAEGFSKGIWVLWNAGTVQLQVSNPQFVHLQGSVGTGDPFFITPVYGKPNVAEKELLWNGMKRIANSICGPWLLAGDFDALLSSLDNRGGAPFSLREHQPFIDALADCGLVDACFKGPRFTWKWGDIHERLIECW